MAFSSCRRSKGVDVDALDEEGDADADADPDDDDAVADNALRFDLVPCLLRSNSASLASILWRSRIRNSACLSTSSKRDPVTDSWIVYREFSRMGEGSRPLGDGGGRTLRGGTIRNGNGRGIPLLRRLCFLQHMKIQKTIPAATTVPTVPPTMAETSTCGSALFGSVP